MVLNVLLVFLCLYFIAMSGARFIGFKVPNLFILAMVGVVVGLSLVNLSESLADAITVASTMIYWAETGLLGMIVIVLAVLHFKNPKI